MSKHSRRVGVLGASGYTGAELLRYLARHPALELVWATADRNAGRTLGEVFGHLDRYRDLRLAPTDPADAPELDAVFLAVPHGEAAEIGAHFRSRGTRVVDLSADWRLRDPLTYESWYGWDHPHPDHLAEWVYGLPEVYREAIADASGVANPGCYPTAALLPLVPLLRGGTVEPHGMVVDAASGVSGAGRRLEPDFLFSELDASYRAYGVGRHRHTPEIEQELEAAAHVPVHVTFTPHLVPMARGLLATCYARLVGDLADARHALESAYKGESFVRVLPEGLQPATKHVSGSNHALIALASDARTGTAVVTCAIDNLGKGAAGQAVQNANLMLGLPETSGLEGGGVYP